MIRLLSVRNLMTFVLSCLLIFGCAAAFAAEEVDYQKIAKEIQKEVAEALEKAQKEIENADIDAIVKNVEKALEEAMKQIEDIDLDDIMDKVEQKLEKGLEKLENVDIDDVMEKVQKHLDQLPEKLKHLEGLGDKIDKSLNKHLASLNGYAGSDTDVFSSQSVEELEKKFKGKIVRKKTDETYTVQAGTGLVMDCAFSSISVVPNKEADTIKVSVDQIAGADTEEIAQKILDGMELTLKQTPNTVSIQVEIKDDQENRKKTKNSMMKTIINVQVPGNTPVTVKNSFGDVSIKDVGGTVDGNNSFGSTFLSGTKDDLTMIGKYGKLVISNHDGKGKINNQFGDLTVNGWTGPIDLSSSYGKSRITGLKADAVLHSDNSFGDITVEIPSDFSGVVEAVSSFGKISVPEKFEMKKEMFSESAKGTIGSGNGSIQIKSSYSPVNILMK